MLLMRSTDVLREFFAPGAIDIRTLNAAIVRGDVPGLIWRLGSPPSYFVDLDRFLVLIPDELRPVSDRTPRTRRRNGIVLMLATHTLRKYFPPKAMDLRTFKRAIARGDVPGQIWTEGTFPQYWVDIQYFELQTGNELADRVLLSLNYPTRSGNGRRQSSRSAK